MQASIFTFLLLIVPLFAFAFSSAPYSDYESETGTNERFARDVDARKKFAFAFAKRSAGGDELIIDNRDIPQRFARESGMKFAFAKRRSPKEFARFARASFA